MSTEHPAGGTDGRGSDQPLDRTGAGGYASLLRRRTQVQRGRDRKLDRARAKRWLRDRGVLLMEETVANQDDLDAILQAIFPEKPETLTIAAIEEWGRRLGSTVRTTPVDSRRTDASRTTDEGIDGSGARGYPRSHASSREVFKAYLKEARRRSDARWIPIAVERSRSGSGQHVSMRFYEDVEGSLRIFYKHLGVLDVRDVTVHTNRAAPDVRLLEISLDPVHGLSLDMLFEKSSGTEFDPNRLVVRLDGWDWNGLGDLQLSVRMLQEDVTE